MNRTIMESARSMLIHAKLPKKFWAEAVAHAAAIRNCFPGPDQHSLSSQEIFTGTKPRLEYIRVFGCSATVHIPKEKRKKLDAKSEEGILIGCLDRMRYKVWLPSTRDAVIARHVRIREDRFPGGWIFGNVLEPYNTDLCGSDSEEEDEAAAQPSHEGGDSEPSSSTPRVDPLLYIPPTQTTLESNPSPDGIAEGQADQNGEEDGLEQSNRRYPLRDRLQVRLLLPGSANAAVDDSEGPMDMEAALNSSNAAQ